MYDKKKYLKPRHDFQLTWELLWIRTKTPSVHHFENTVYKQGRLGQPSAWDRSLHYYDPHHAERTAQYLLAVDALNFCFWEDAEFDSQSVKS